MIRVLGVIAGVAVAATPLFAAQVSRPLDDRTSITESEVRSATVPRRGHVISPADVRWINERLAKGRVVEVQPALMDVEYALPPEVAQFERRIERLPAGLPIVIVEVENDGAIAGEAPSSIFDAEAVIFQQRADSGFVLTNKADAGNLIANQIYPGNGFLAGDRISGYDLLVYVDPDGGPSSVKVSLWDGDPQGIVDTTCAGVPSPIPGTATTFTDLPPASEVCPAIDPHGDPSCLGLLRLRATLPEDVRVFCQAVWMVLEVEEGCNVGWRINGRLEESDVRLWRAAPTIGFSDYIETVVDADTTAGTCCDSGAPCDHTDNDCATGATFCTDGVAEDASAFSLFAAAGSGYYASLVAGMSAPALSSIALVPVGNGPDGRLDPGVVIEGNEIRMPPGARRVLIEARIGDWDPQHTGVSLKAYQVKLDSASYTSGPVGTLTPASLPCNSNSECAAALGVGATCDFPVGSNTCAGACSCTPAFIDRWRPDFVLPGALCAVDFTTPSLRGGCSFPGIIEPDTSPFPEAGFYGLTFVLDVPADARGTFTVRLQSPPDTSIATQDNPSVRLLGLAPAKITIIVGRCCYDLDASFRCIDLVTEEECNALPGPRVFTEDGACGDATDACVDCNDNQHADVLDLADGTSLDCNGNHIPDECELPPIDPDGQDCNANGVPDVCDTDCDENGVPDHCEPALCLALAAPQADPTSPVSNRYLSVLPGNSRCDVALRVTFTQMPEGFEHLEGLTMWAGTPEEVCEHAGQAAPPPEGCAFAPDLESSSFFASELGCDPVFTAFGAFGTLHLFHEAIVPGALYTVEAIDSGCDPADESSFSAPLLIDTGTWGDVAGPFDIDSGRWTAPDGRVDVITDIVAMLEKFASRPGAPLTTAADVAPARPDGRIDITVDVVFAIDAFRGLPYPFDAPEPCP